MLGYSIDSNSTKHVLKNVAGFDLIFDGPPF